MLLLPRAVRILLAAEPVDLRKSIDGLEAIVRTNWHENVFAGHLFVFMSRRRDRVKVLTWDSGGFIVFYKRLEQGRFRLPAFQDGALGAALDATQLTMLLDGIDVSRVRSPQKWSPQMQEGDRQAPNNLINSGRWHPARTVRLTTAANGGTGRRRSKPKSARSRTSSTR